MPTVLQDKATNGTQVNVQNNSNGTKLQRPLSNALKNAARRITSGDLFKRGSSGIDKVDNEVKGLQSNAAALANKKPARKNTLLRRLSKSAGNGLRRISKRAATRWNIISKSQRGLRAIKGAPTKSQLLPSISKGAPGITGSRPRAVVVGGGPAGSTAAMYLARNGYDVDVYEGRAEPSSVSANAQRAYMIALTDRGLAALEDLGVDIPQGGSGQHQGGQIAVHSRLGTLSTSCEERSVCFTRAGLAQMLIDQAKTKYPENIRFHFNYACEGVDVAGKTVMFKQRIDDNSSGGGTCSGNSAAGPSNPIVEVEYDLLVGADGVNSVVRGSLQAAMPEMQVDISDSGRQYKAFHSLPPAGLKGAEGKECSTLHLWPGSDPASMVSAHTAGDGTFSGTLSLRTGEFDGLHSTEDIEKMLRERFPKLPQEWLEPMAAQAAASGKATSVGKRVTCSQMHGPGVVLLGDAAHAVTPVFGQGANSALESCMVLGQALENAGGDTEAVPAAFNALRSPDTLALGELDAKAHSLFWRSTVFDGAFMQVATHLVLGGLLTLASGGKKPNLVQIGSTVPYNRIKKELERDGEYAKFMSGAVGMAAFVTAFASAITLG